MRLNTKPKQKRPGLVYLLRAGKENLYKIGVTTRLPERLAQLAPQSPFHLTCGHVIRTDDMLGVEGYWHTRFKAKRLNGEWFALTLEDTLEFSKWRVATVAKTGRLEPLDQLTLQQSVYVYATKTKDKKKMPVAERGVDVLCSEGEHFMQLQPVVEDRVTSKFSKDQDGKSDIWYWKFISKKRDPDTGEFESIRVMTDAKMTPNNNQGKLWKQIKPELAKLPFEQWTGDTTEVESKWFKVMVRHEQKGDKTYANAAFITPYTPKPAAPKPAAAPTPAPVSAATEPPEEGDDLDPFADEPQEA